MSIVRTYIVEDNPVILCNLRDTLEDLTDVHVVGTAEDEAVAVDCIRDDMGEIDLMIIDVFLKTGSGLAVLRSAQQMKFRAKRVILTNYATPEVRRRCAALGADRVFDKSCEIEDLIEYCGRISDGTALTPGSVS